MGERAVCFNVWYGGKFETLEDRSMVYIRGREMVLESEPHALFRGLGNALTVPLSRQRLWYKLPVEDFSDLKILCDKSLNFEKMCEVANCTGCIEIYMEKDEDGDEYGEEATDNLKDGSNEVCAEESRVENIISDIVDDEDEVSGDMVRTPPPSDGEEEDENHIYYKRWKRGRGELAIRQVFVSVEEFKEAVLEYALMGGWNVKMTKSGAIKLEARCAVRSEKPCPWRIYLTSKWVAQYSDTIEAMNGLKFWKKSGEPTLTAPPREPSTGRNKLPEKRKKGINEEPKKRKKVTNHGRTMQCYRCGLMRHNSLKCNNGGVPYKPRKPKKAKT